MLRLPSDSEGIVAFQIPGTHTDLLHLGAFTVWGVSWAPRYRRTSDLPNPLTPIRSYYIAKGSAEVAIPGSFGL